MPADKRLGLGPIPASPEIYINEKQVDGMLILKKFGWRLVCIRRQALKDALPLFRNAQEKTVGVLGKDGILRILPDIKIRQPESSKDLEKK
jgi:hypothetical protein